MSTPTTPKPKVNLTINGKAISVDAGTSVFNAAVDAGIFVPHYCYHPDLSVAGVCRMCMVEIEKNPRLQISCNTIVAEGMVVKTDTPKVKDTVKNVLELHLINHPVDCPICDKAGECKLQDFYSSYGLYESRMELEEKVHKPKKQDIGTIVLDSERCILCSRCVRFTAEVTKTNELGIFNRGDRSELRTFDRGPLRNDYTGNLADICPVGALTAKDFRFQQRVWFLEEKESICTMCSTGCNTTVSYNPKTKKLFRVEPKRNVEVNKSWICDTGRWNYHYVNDQSRMQNPRHLSDGRLVEESWHSFFQDFHAELQERKEKVLVGLSTFMTNEEAADAVQTLSELGVKDFAWVVEEGPVGEEKTSDGILKHADLSPNAFGVKKTADTLGVKLKKYQEVEADLKAGRYERVLLLGLEGLQMPGVAKFLLMVPKEVKIAAHATNFVGPFEKCDWVLPNTSSFEKSGTMMNFKGLSQRVQGALPPQYTSRNCHQVLFGIAEGGDRHPIDMGKVSERVKEFAWHA